LSESWTLTDTGEKKSTNESEGKPQQKFDLVLGTIFRISKCFLRSKQKLFISFLLNKAG
jgi:hypothetical protein